LEKKCLKLIIPSIIVLIFGATVYSVYKNSRNSQETKLQNNIQGTSSLSQNVKADKIEVVHFHTTRQCYSCITIGKYAKKVVEEKLLEENKSNKVVFLDVNIDLEENEEIVSKFQARGSSLFVNVIYDDKNHIQEDTSVWRLVSNENQYLEYFENKLKEYL